MANTIKVTNESQNNSLNKGKFWIGTGDADMGPTSTTGFYTGITPPEDGYTIHLDRGEDYPSLLVADSDSELITLTNQIAGTSYTTIQQCFSYFHSQTDKMVLGHNLEFTHTDGLVFNLDAKSLAAYSGEGENVTDLSKEGNNGTLINNPSFDRVGALEFNGTDEYLLIPADDSTNIRTTSISVSMVCKSGTTNWNSYWSGVSKYNQFILGPNNTGGSGAMAFLIYSSGWKPGG